MGDGGAQHVGLLHKALGQLGALHKAVASVLGFWGSRGVIELDKAHSAPYRRRLQPWPGGKQATDHVARWPHVSKKTGQDPRHARAKAAAVAVVVLEERGGVKKGESEVSAMIDRTCLTLSKVPW